MRLKENEIIEQLKSNIEKYAPLAIKSIEREAVLTEGRADAIIEFSIADGSCFKALIEIKTTATPKIISQAAQQIKSYLNNIDDKAIVPLVIVPYMGPEQAKILQREGVSWIDLCGNMKIKVEGKIYIERIGNKNQFPDTSPIKKIFEGTSSLVSRALLLKKEPFKTLFEIVDFINKRNGNITLATVSKVIRSLEEGLLIAKSKKSIVVTNRESLLGKLLDGYRDYTRRYKNNVYKFTADDTSNLSSLLFYRNVTYAACGFYAAKLKGLATTDRINIVVQFISEAKKAFENQPANIRPDSEFGQIELIETKNPCVWFDLQGMTMSYIIDDIELYLEMMLDTPRGPKVAEILKERILKGQV